jgi:hypothetical protein
MSWVPFAIKKPINVDPGDPPRTNHRALILHTAVTSADSLYAAWKTGPIEAHFYLRKDGTLEQYLDTTGSADHAVGANPWALGLESQDGGPSNLGPWTPAALDTIDRLCRFLGIPAQPLKCVPSEGIGYHRQCSVWNPNLHSCPGDEKVRQIPGIIARLKEDDLNAEQDQMLRDLSRKSNMLETLATDLRPGQGLDYMKAGRIMARSLLEPLTQAEVGRIAAAVVAALPPGGPGGPDLDVLADLIVDRVKARL